MKGKKNSKINTLLVLLGIFLVCVFLLIGKEIMVKNKCKQSKIGNNGMDEVDIIKTDSSEINQDKNEDINNNIIKNVSENDSDLQLKNISNEDEQTPKDINYMQISNENKLRSCYILGEFNNGKALSTDQYLKVVYNALNNSYISSGKTNYSEDEINNIVYSIFNIKLNEHKSVDGLAYKKGIYSLNKTKSEIIELANIQCDVAAGNTYIEYDVDDKSFVAKLGTNTITGETYIISIIKN